MSNIVIEYLKRPIEFYDLKEIFKDDIKISQDIYFDLYFAKKLFEKKNGEKEIKALCLILFLLGQYSESLDIVLNNSNFKDLLVLFLKNIPDKKLKKKIWLQIFENKKISENLDEAKSIIKESKGVIKLEDILPLMGDDVKINEFKSELKNCIENYEKRVNDLDLGIKEFNDAMI